MPTLILSRRYSDDSNSLWRAAMDAGWDAVRLMTYEGPPELRERDPVYYGETLLADAIAEPLGLALLEPSHDWLPSLDERWRRRAVRLSTLAEARALDAPAFVKAVDEKWMVARVYASGADLDASPALAGDLPVLIQEPVDFEVELRAFVSGRTVAALSPYMLAGEIARGADGEWTADAAHVTAAAAFLDALLADEAVALPRGVVVDVGRIRDRGWAVVEANAAWASGLCGADPRAVLSVIRAACVPRVELAASEERWIRRPVAS